MKYIISRRETQQPIDNGVRLVWTMSLGPASNRVASLLSSQKLQLQNSSRKPATNELSTTRKWLPKFHQKLSTKTTHKPILCGSYRSKGLSLWNPYNPNDIQSKVLERYKSEVLEASKAQVYGSLWSKIFGSLKFEIISSCRSIRCLNFSL